MRIGTRIGLGVLLLCGVFVAVGLANENGLRRTTLRVAEMRCSSCLRVIDAELRRIPGLVGMTGTFSPAQVVVDHEAAVAAEEIAAIITGVGYQATIVASQPIREEQAHRFQRAGFGAGAGCCNPGGASPVAESWKELRRRFLPRDRDANR
jgi:copper chaperone CopZ